MLPEAGLKDYPEQGNKLINLDLCKVLEVELYLWDQEKEKVEQVIAEIFRQDTNALNALIPSGNAPCKSRDRDDSPLYMDLHLQYIVLLAIQMMERYKMKNR